MTARVKLIWDFRGPNAHPIAVHHAKHLDEFAGAEGIPNAQTGIETLSDMHTIAFLIVPWELMESLRSRLKPNRGQKVTET
ncbi:hypothetical protein [Altibacter sp.]|uniref:hypothetical protein n=1 Tax=Altibacter sp. TaxID=2024823 RepID=UPI00258AA7C2|nr:hypothetical protein [Altibacter sp.]MCW8981775.1 hypothetical protein [Altibacter sp.]MCW9036956.1 hypothetical protein [Altibacter sp.]